MRRVDDKTLEWTTPHGFTFHVDPNGTHRILRADDLADLADRRRIDQPRAGDDPTTGEPDTDPGLAS